MKGFEDINARKMNEPSLGDGIFIAQWSDIAAIERVVERNAKYGIPTVLDFSHRPRLSSKEEAKLLANLQVSAEYNGVRVAVINVCPSDQVLLAKSCVRYKLADREAAAEQLVIDDVISRILHKMRSIGLDDEALRALIEEEIDDPRVAEDVLQLLSETRKAYRAYIDPIGIFSMHSASDVPDQVLPTDMVILDKMLLRFGKHPSQS